MSLALNRKKQKIDKEVAQSSCRPPGSIRVTALYLRSFQVSIFNGSKTTSWSYILHSE